MQLLDTNGDGHIDVTEFLVAIRVSQTTGSNEPNLKTVKRRRDSRIETKPTLESDN